VRSKLVTIFLAFFHLILFSIRDEIEFAASLITDLVASAQKAESSTQLTSDAPPLLLNTPTLRKLKEYLGSSSSSPLLVTGCEGSGASSILSLAISDLKSGDRCGAEPLIVHCDVGKGNLAGERTYLNVLKHFVDLVTANFTDLKFSDPEYEANWSLDEESNSWSHSFFLSLFLSFFLSFSLSLSLSLFLSLSLSFSLSLSLHISLFHIDFLITFSIFLFLTLFFSRQGRSENPK
jgi:hypothetical protein